MIPGPDLSSHVDHRLLWLLSTPPLRLCFQKNSVLHRRSKATFSLAKYTHTYIDRYAFRRGESVGPAGLPWEMWVRDLFSPIAWEGDACRTDRDGDGEWKPPAPGRSKEESRGATLELTEERRGRAAWDNYSR